MVVVYTGYVVVTVGILSALPFILLILILFAIGAAGNYMINDVREAREITGIYLMTRVIDDWLKSLDETDVLKGFHGLEIGRIDDIRTQLKRDIEKSGWEKAGKSFIKAVSDSFGTCWWSENLFLSSVLEIEDYLGCEAQILDILREVEDCTTFRDVVDQTITKLDDILNTQLQRGASTVFLSVEAFKKRISYGFIPRILEIRRTNFLQAMNRFRLTKTRPEDALQLLQTAYGFNVVMALERPRTRNRSWAQILKILDEVYTTLGEDGNPAINSHEILRQSEIVQLAGAVALDHVLRMIGKRKQSDLCLNSADGLLVYKTGYRDIYAPLATKSFLRQEEYEFAKMILDGIGTEKASKALERISSDVWITHHVR
jgi:hypothetical protein